MKPNSLSQTVGKTLSPVSLSELQESRGESQSRRVAAVNTGRFQSCLQKPKILRCTRIEDGFQFFPPFLPKTDANSQEVNSFNSSLWARYSWAREAQVKNGDSFIATLLQAAHSHALSNCEMDNCSLAISVPQLPNSERIELCTVEQVQNEVGPPHNCEAIAARYDAEWWVEVIDGVEPISLPQGMSSVYRLDIVGLPRAAIFSVLDRAIAGLPLVMPNRAVKTDHILAIAPRRFSHILAGGWFEWPQILVELDDEFHVEISLDLIVNKQNTDDPADWHLPTDQQMEEYQKAIAESVTKALTAVCVGPRWEGTRELACDKLRTTDGALVSIPEDALYSEKKLDSRIVRQRKQD
jgi:hypothetical protein